MIELILPGHKPIHLQHLVCDVNGTLALDGRLVNGVQEALASLAGALGVHLITADTHGRQAELDRQLGLTGVRIPCGEEAKAKAAFVRQLGASQVVAIGQGANDAAMLAAAQVGIAVLSEEGTAVEALTAADVVAPGILAALALLQNPRRLVATLRR